MFKPTRSPRWWSSSSSKLEREDQTQGYGKEEAADNMDSCSLSLVEWNDVSKFPTDINLWEPGTINRNSVEFLKS
jgi:hypothetical protein